MRDNGDVRGMARLLQAVADPTRLRLLKCLQVRPACVCELMQATELPQPRVSRHHKILRDSGLLEDRRDAQWVEYSLAWVEEGTAEADVLGLVAGQLADDPEVIADRRRLAAASRTPIEAAEHLAGEVRVG